jgi:hypothetical protein
VSNRFDPADDPIRRLAGRLSVWLLGAVLVVALVASRDALLSGQVRLVVTAAAGVSFWAWAFVYAVRYRRHVLRTGTQRSAALDGQMALGAAIFLGLSVALVVWATWDRGFAWQYLWSFVLPLYALQASRTSRRLAEEELAAEPTQG